MLRKSSSPVVAPALFWSLCICCMLLWLLSSPLLPEAAGQEESPEQAEQEKIADSSPTTEELQNLIRDLEDEKKREELIRDLKALLAANRDVAEKEAEEAGPLGWSWRGVGSWFAEKGQTLQQMTGTRKGRIKLLQRILLSLLLLSLAAAVWYLIRRRLPEVFSSSSFTLILGRVIFTALLLLLLLAIWGADVRALLLGPATVRISGKLAVIMAVIVLGIVAWEVFKSYLKKRAAWLETGTLSGRRMQTLIPLLRNVVRIVIIVICLLIIMSELGINIAPLLAGAGILGLAVGFGAQTLVKDLINGFLILAENAINVGDWVMLGGHDGQVESLSIRNVRIRDIYGNVNIVPWSSVETVVNQTMDYGWAVVEPGVAYRENIDEVIQVVKDVAAEMRQDPAINQDILSDLQILGLIELGDSAVIIRTRFKTTPFRRWFLERDFRRRLKNRFDELGIEIPYPHSTVYFGQDKQGWASPARIEVLGKGQSEQQD